MSPGSWSRFHHHTGGLPTCRRRCARERCCRNLPIEISSTPTWDTFFGSWRARARNCYRPSIFTISIVQGQSNPSIASRVRWWRLHTQGRCTHRAGDGEGSKPISGCDWPRIRQWRRRSFSPAQTLCRNSDPRLLQTRNALLPAGSRSYFNCRLPFDMA